MPSRAPHEKSRNGCMRCKERRVKCDKQGPVCGNCHRRSEHCEFPTWKQVSPMSVVTRDMNTSSNETSVMRISPQPSLTEVPLSILFFPKIIGKTNLGYQPAVQETRLWAQVLRSKTVEHRYLRHCLSSIRCLYAETYEPSSHQVNHPRAYQHQITASSMFRSSPSTIGESNWLAVLVFAISVLIFQFASQQVSGGPFDYVETLRVLKMSSGVALSVGPFLTRSEMWTFINRRNKLALRPIDPTLLAAIQDLENSIAMSNSGDKDVLMDAVQALKKWINMCHGSPHNWRYYCLFPGMVSEEYLQLLAEEDDSALLIMIYWCAVMRLGPKRWFFERWLIRASALAQAKLTGNWSDVLEWANTKLNVGADKEFAEKVNEYRKSEELMMFF